ncbi:MAG: GntR family transcriptional regulator [Anaerolineae bacterium]|nr:GntR family transcriptional regulator [Anaerolineae bacterium]
MLKRTPSLTEQAKAHLKQRIINDEFDDGRIPSETDLADALGVSRTTIRDALSRLELEGVVYRKQGAGTFVNKAGLQIKTRLEEIWTYEAMLKAHGYTPATRIISVEEQPTSTEIATTLQLDPDQNLLVIKKLFLADNRPVILVDNQIPASIIKTNYTPEDFRQPTYQFLSTHCQQHLAYYLSEIIPLVAPAWLTKILDLPKPKTALLAFDEVGYNQDNQPVIKTCSYFRDDLLRLRLIRREAT